MHIRLEGRRKGPPRNLEQGFGNLWHIAHHLIDYMNTAFVSPHLILRKTILPPQAYLATPQLRTHQHVHSSKAPQNYSAHHYPGHNIPKPALSRAAMSVLRQGRLRERLAPCVLGRHPAARPRVGINGVDRCPKDRPHNTVRSRPCADGQVEPLRRMTEFAHGQSESIAI
ncbi:hypothetical protein BDV09DRAFT_175232 [Aspergillus tetrazonus]